MRNLYLIVLLITVFGCNDNSVLYENVLDNPENWIVEQQPNGQTIFNDKSIEIIDAKGCTIWFKNKLHAPVKISYDVTVIDEGGKYDRVSDMNCLWMANDPKNPDDFFKASEERAGIFPNYHHFTGYYVGYGGHHNTKTRFRRYNGNVNRSLLPEHDLSNKKFMITANKKMHIEIVVKDSLTSYSRNGEIIYKIKDNQPYTSGYFGFRTVNNHMKIENFKVEHY
ncbi:DUF6250 domain-containing protein [Hwangdonia lutea]|uniref:DUF6250 domain-containing protein n=1 Tax=Hwangdonia lutea TaxID=3075823 RepID=A0AA97EK19_9FLAO|nr:DUF6250 domain-containing protein [Hwangdonia sp. SCSIO 19198]WOD42881.1 DUF6250 domain-containing protein [Hwangdonia sp. SCSIO 19198]